MILAAVVDAHVGGGELEYQWYKDDEALPGATSPELTIPNATTADSGIYELRAKGWAGEVARSVTVLVAPELTVDGVIYSDLGATLSAARCADSCGEVLVVPNVIDGQPVRSIGPAAFSYSGLADITVGTRVNSVKAGAFYGISDQAVVRFLGTGDAPDFEELAFGGSGDKPFYRKASAEGTWPESVGGHPIVAVSAPTFTTQPSSATATAGQYVNLRSVVDAHPGGGELSYQWFKGNTAVAGATSPELSLANVQASDSGSYTLRVTGWAGQTVSQAAVVEVSSPPQPEPSPSASAPAPAPAPAPAKKNQQIKVKLPATLKRGKTYQLPKLTNQGQSQTFARKVK